MILTYFSNDIIMLYTSHSVFGGGGGGGVKRREPEGKNLHQSQLFRTESEGTLTRSGFSARMTLVSACTVPHCWIIDGYEYKKRDTCNTAWTVG